MMNKMYKAPENANRVKTIKSKFENIEKNKKGDRNNSLISTENGTRNNLNEIIQNNDLAGPANPKILERQLSDPAKRNIKRTPAFRLDKNSEKTNVFQRGTNFNKSNNFTNILKPVNIEPKMNCASDVNNLKESNIDVHKVVIKSSNVKPLLLKSKSSHDFNLILSRFAAANLNVTNPKNNNESRRQNLNTHSVKNVTALYTEPIPKALRSKLNDEHVYLNTKKLDDKPSNKTSTIGDIHNSSTLRISDLKVNFNKKSEVKSVIDPIKHNLTDTLKYALKRPLPGGPAPKKPPRTFQHFSKDDNTENLEKNKSFLHLTQNLEKQKNTKTKHQTKKADAKYMLDKLETALRNNKLKSLKHAKHDVSTTSGEDSDDSLLFKSKGSDKTNNSEALREGRLLPAVPDINDHRSNNSSTKLFAQALNFNCLNALSCNSPYERVKESNSSFFVNSKNEEPVYAEPFHFQTDNNDQEKRRLIDKSENKRNSLYYMSSPVLGSDLNDSSTDIERSTVKQKDVPYTEKPIPDLLKIPMAWKMKRNYNG